MLNILQGQCFVLDALWKNSTAMPGIVQKNFMIIFKYNIYEGS
jgi:hypothetical protein